MHHKPAPPGITYDSFLQAAEQRQFFSKSMMLPLFLASEQQNNLSEDVAQKLRSLIHMHSEQMMETVKESKNTVGERARWRIDVLAKEIHNGLFDNFAATAGIRGSGAKVMRPLAAYRRLLAYLLHLRCIRHEQGDGFVLQGEGNYLDQVKKKMRTKSMVDKVPQLKKLGGEEFVDDIIGKEDGDKTVVVGNDQYEIVAPSKVLAQSTSELDSLR